MWRALGSLGIRRKLVLLSLVILLVVSFAFTFLHLRMAKNLAEEDLRERAVTFAREIAATIGDRREFENSGGTITVRTSAGAVGAEIEVIDCGCGIPETERARIFEPFFSTKAGRRGAGLGLFIASEVVREHRGRIDLASEPGKGTTFRVQLPAEQDRP